MAVTVAVTLKVHPGKQNELFETLKTIKKIVQRAGGTYVVRRQVAGALPNSIIAVSQYPDWNSLGKFRSDPELQKVMDQIRSSKEPAAEPVTTAILEDVAI